MEARTIFNRVYKYKYMDDGVMKENSANFIVHARGNDDIIESPGLEIRIILENPFISYINVVHPGDSTEGFGEGLQFEDISSRLVSLLEEVGSSNTDYFIFLAFPNSVTCTCYIRRKSERFMCTTAIELHLTKQSDEQIRSHVMNNIIALKNEIVELKMAMDHANRELEESNIRCRYLEEQQNGQDNETNFYWRLQVEQREREKDNYWTKEMEKQELQLNSQMESLQLNCNNLMMASQMQYQAMLKGKAHEINFLNQEIERMNVSLHLKNQEHEIAKSRIVELTEENSRLRTHYTEELARMKQANVSISTKMRNMKLNQDNMFKEQCELSQVISQQKSYIKKLEESYNESKNSNIALSVINRQKDRDIEDVRRAMKNVELSFQKQSLKDTDLINSLRTSLASKDSQVQALEESVLLIKKDKTTLRQMFDKLYQHYETLQGDVKEEVNMITDEEIDNRDESYYNKFVTDGVAAAAKKSTVFVYQGMQKDTAPGSSQEEKEKSTSFEERKENKDADPTPSTLVQSNRPINHTVPCGRAITKKRDSAAANYHGRQEHKKRDCPANYDEPQKRATGGRAITKMRDSAANHDGPQKTNEKDLAANCDGPQKSGVTPENTEQIKLLKRPQPLPSTDVGEPERSGK